MSIPGTAALALTGARGLYFKTAVEWLEPRCMLSAQPIIGIALPTIELALANGSQGSATPAGSASPPSGAYSPTQILNAYNFNQVTFSGGTVQGNGAGQTIAIIDAYYDPNITADAAAFSTNYSLPQFGSTNGPTLTISSQTGGSVTSVSKDPSGDDWGLETSLDVEWIHALAPDANILPVETNSDQLPDLLAGVKYATSQPNVSVVSMSWGASESASELNDDGFFTTPSGHQGITFVSSAGDTGTPGGYPAYSPNVLSVGGTNLQLSGGNYSSETVWNDGVNQTTGVIEATGGGISSIEGEPSYQDNVVPAADSNNGANRAMPDVAFDADPNTGVAVVDSYDYGSTPWIQVGGTSFGAPAWASIMAIADQGRATEGLGTLNSASQTLPDIYAMPSSDFHDITSGSNGTYSATAGYDLVTGRGTPIVSSVVGYFDNFSLTQIAVSSTSPAAGSSVSVPMTSLTLEFNEAYAASSISTSNLTLSQGTVTGFTLVNPTTVTYTLSGLTSPGTLTVSIAAGAITDINGGAGAAFSANYTLIASGLTAGIPVGSLVYEASAAGTVGSGGGGIVRYTLNVAAGETITALVVPGTLAYTELAITGPSGFSFKFVQGAGDQVLQTETATASGTYTFSIFSHNGDTGTFTLDVFLNAAVSTSAIGGASNNQYSTAQDLSASFESTGPSASRGAVVGVTNGLSNGSLSDYYAVSLAAGQTVTLAATDESGAAGTINVSLLNSGGTTVATGTPMTTNVDGTVENFTASTAGTYYVDVTGTAANITYVLVVTRGADFDLKGNSSLATAQNISGTDGVLGAIQSAAPTDWYAVNLAAGASLSLQTYTFGGTTANSDYFIDSVQPQIQLYSPAGTLIASGSGGTNQSLVANASAAGTYYVEVTGGSGTTGEYFLGISTAPAVSITPISPSPTNAAVSQMQIVFSGPVLGMSQSDLSLSFNGGPNLLTGTQSLTTADDKTFTLSGLAPLTGANGVYTLTVAANSGITNQNGVALQTGTSTTFTVDTNPPEIAGIYVSSTAWSQAFLNYLASPGVNLGSATLGYLIPSGSSQTTDLPWENINTISVVFNENVSINTADSALELIGSPNLPAPAALSSATFTYSSTTHTAQWTFSSPLATDKDLLSIPAADVTDSLGSTLDGEWPTLSSTYPSGNGVAGGNFNFLFNILQGDANQDGAVTGTDGNGVRLLLLQNTTSNSYSPYFDLVGSGTITGIDGSYVRVNLTDTLPATGPTIPGGGSGNVVTAVSPAGTTDDANANSLTGGTSATSGRLSGSTNSSSVLTLADFSGTEPLVVGALPSNALAAGSSQTALKLVTVAPSGGTNSTPPFPHAGGLTAVEGNSAPSVAALDSLLDSSPLNFAPEQVRSPLRAETIASVANFEVSVASSAAAHGNGFVDPNGDLNRSSMGDSSGDPISADSDGDDPSRGEDIPMANWLTDLILEQEFDWLDF